MALDAMTARLLIGDARERIKEIPDGSIDLTCTSPPFLALRKYGDKSDAEMGSEASPAAFIDALLDLAAEFRRVLAPHGSIAIELGDTYAGDDRRRSETVDAKTPHRSKVGRPASGRANVGNGWPLAKSLAGIPEAFMLSLAYGYNVLNRHAPDSPAGRWRVRNVIVWARPNPPVGALGDKVRPATSYITIACTSDKRWFDLDAVRTPHEKAPEERTVQRRSAAIPIQRPGEGERTDGKASGEGFVNAGNPAGAPPLDWWEDDDPTGHATLIHPTHPYPGAHYATWPPTLAKRLIEMMAPLRVCTVCGEPSRRITERTEEYAAARAEIGDFNQRNRNGAEGVSGSRSVLSKAAGRAITSAENVTTGWTDCGHNAWRNGHVLDPFAGSGTTLAVAQGCGRDATGIELYESNGNLIADRLGMFLDVVT